MGPPQVCHIYSEIGQRDIFPVVDTNGFDDVSLQSTSGGGSNGSVSTAYRVPGTYTVEHSGTQWNKVDSEKNTTPFKANPPNDATTHQPHSKTTHPMTQQHTNPIQS